MTEEKVVIIWPERGADDLRDLLKRGWKVKCLAGGSVASTGESNHPGIVFAPFLVIIEKEVPNA
jgi:hypothetical protein